MSLSRQFAKQKAGWFSFILLTMLCAILAPATKAQVLDRIVATVNGRVILQSDWDEALCYEALLSARSLDDFTAEERRGVLDRLIDQELLREQMKSADFRHATPEEAAARVVEARKLYPQAQTDDGWKQILLQHQVAPQELLAHVQQQIDLMRLVDARLRPTVQIDSKTVEAYYRDKFVPQLKQSGSSEVPLAEVSGKIRELLTQQRVSELLVSWLQTLRSESKVSIPGAPAITEQGDQTR